MWRDDFIAVDWGTTNRRAWHIGPDGEVKARVADDQGLLSVPPGEFDRAVADIREWLGDYPMLLAGMVGSDRGWRKAPYVAAPADSDALAAGLLWIDARTAIVPGVCQTENRPDVMRGEEVQALGAYAAGEVGPDALLCHPGTHSKWIRLAEGKICSFETMMTGEMFSLLRDHSILGQQMGSDVFDGESFRAGLEEAASGPSLLAALFGMRARQMLDCPPSGNAAFASGLLIGHDVRAGLRNAHPDETIVVVGEAALSKLYATAIGAAGFEATTTDVDHAFLSGLSSIRKRLEKQ